MCWWQQTTARLLVWTMVIGNVPGPIASSAPPHPSAPSAPSAPFAPPAPVASVQASSSVLLFPPTQYLRTTGPTNIYTASLAVPPWVVAPFTLHVQNGEPDGTRRLSSAAVEVNGVEVAVRSDFSQQVGSFDKPVTLGAQNNLRFILDSVPQGRIYASFFGTNGDFTAPSVTIVSPVADAITNATGPLVVVRYQDAVGTSDAAASGVDLASLQVRIDGADRTADFAKTGAEATLQLAPGMLAAGAHTIVARLSDTAGNAAEVTRTFRVDFTPPALVVVEPAAGAFLRDATPTISVTYGDEVAIDLDTFQILVNAFNRTALFAKTETGAAATLDAASALADGDVLIAVRIRDRAGNEATAERGFHVDTAPPAIVVAAPADGFVTNAASVDVTGAVTDASPVTLRIGGVEVPVTGGAFAYVFPLPVEGVQAIALDVTDAAGNTSSGQVSVTADRTPPIVTIPEPVAAAILNITGPRLVVRYQDGAGGTGAVTSGVDLASLRIQLDGVDRTADFARAGAEATLQLSSGALGEGAHTLVATIADRAGNTAGATTAFRVDLTLPALAIVEPVEGSYLATATPALRVTYGDEVGVDLDTFEVLVNGVDRTALFAKTDTVATATLDAASALAEGDALMVARLSDRAGNEATTERRFSVDLTPPAVTLTSPVAASYVRGPEVPVAGTLSDASPVTLTVNGNAVQVGADGAFATQVTTGDGPLTIRVAALDAAGNAGAAEAALYVDSVAPVVTVTAPREGLPTSADAIEVTGTVADASPVMLRIGGVDVPVTGGAFAYVFALPVEGVQAIGLEAIDAAGNVARAGVRVTADRTPPALTIASPAADAVTNVTGPRLVVRYQDGAGDAASGLDLESLQVQLDGADRTTDFARSGAEAALQLESGSLAAGLHTIVVRVSDRAGNLTEVTQSFRVDLSPPTVAILEPGEGAFLPTATPAIRLTYGDELEVDVESLEAIVGGVDRTALFTKTETGATATLGPESMLLEGDNQISARIRDRAGNEAVAYRAFRVDLTPPQVIIVEPGDGTWTNRAAIDVRGGVIDASPVIVRVEGVDATLDVGAGFSRPFTANGVPVGGADGSDVTLTAIATDAAGNTGQAALMLRVDRTPPVIYITSPAAGDYVAGPIVSLAGTVSDASPLTVTIGGDVVLVGPNGVFTGQVQVDDGAAAIAATAVDAAGNAAAAQVAINVDSVAPQIAITSPADGLITSAGEVEVTGTVADASPITVRVNFVEVPVTNGAFAYTVGLLMEGAAALVVEATDRAGHTSSATVNVTADRTPPDLAVMAPDAGVVIGNLPVAISGTVFDLTETRVTVNGVAATRAQNAWQAPFASLPEGAQAFTVVATDGAGNQTTETRDVVIDLSPPVVTITSPAPGTLTREGTVAVSGTVTDLSLQSVSVNGVAAALVGAGFSRPFTALVPLAEGDNHLLVSAVDATGRTGLADVDLTRDSTAPLISLDAPDRLARRRTGPLVATATDNLALDRVVVRVNGATLATFTAPPYQLDLAVPEGASAGDVLAVVAEAFDRAGNSATAVASVRVAADGALVGQVLDDVAGLPLPGATATMTVVGAGFSRPETSDDRGRYSFGASDDRVLITVAKSGMTSVEREVEVASETGTLVLDSRLTPLAAPVTIGSAGGTVHAALPSTEYRAPSTGFDLSVSVPPGSVASDTPFHLTLLSQQGLPNVLPLGWSPLVAFDLRAGEGASPLATGTTLALSAVAQGFSPVTLSQFSVVPSIHLVEYDFATHAWRLVAANVPVANGSVTASFEYRVPSPEYRLFGSYALVVVDQMDPPIPVPAVGEPLTGVSVVPLPITATSTGTVDPPSVPPGGGRAIGTLVVESPVALPSGTVVQANVTETYSLASGQIASQEDRSQDLVLFRAPSALLASPAPSAPPAPLVSALFPISPSLSFTPSQLLEGSVTLDIFAGRESVRGSTGGREPVVLTDVTGATLSVPSGALAEDTAVTFQSAILSSFVPVASGLAALAEFVVDLSGRTLGLPATLDVPLSSLASSVVSGFSQTDTLLIARVDRIAAIPRPAVVALATVQGDRVVSTTPPGLPGLVRGGRYVLYLATEAVGFVAGTTRLSDGTGTRAVVETEGLPFIGVAGASVGEYLVAARAGQASVTARVASTSLVGEGSVAVEAVTPPYVGSGFSRTMLDLTLAGAVTTATVTPIDGSVAVSVSAQVEIQSTAPIDPATVTAANVQLLQFDPVVSGFPGPSAVSGSRPVPSQLILSGSGRTLALVPTARLDADARFRLEAANLTDTTGGLIVVPAVTFTTKADVPPTYHTRQLVFGMPDMNGFVTFTGPAGTLPPGTQVLVVNEGTGEVASFTADNDGAIGGSLLASIQDRLLVTITDPLGNVITFERGEYRAPDGTTAVNSAGGVVEGDGGVELRIPPEATEDAVVLQLKALALSLLPEGPLPDLELPEDQLAQLAAALEIKSDGTPAFTQPVDIVFPKPEAAPEGASYFVVRRLTGPDGLVAYETVDVAAVEGEGADAKVVTASDPFSGYVQSVQGFSAMGLDNLGAIGSQFTNYAILMWAFDEALPGKPLGGTITGRVLRLKWNPGSPTPDYEPVAGALVSGVDLLGDPLWATARPGESAGPNVAISQANGTYALMDLRYTGGPVTIAATINGETRTATAYQANPQDLKKPGLNFVRHVAVADITFPALAPPPPAPALPVKLFVEDADGKRSPVTGVVVAGTPVIIGTTASDLTIRGAEIAGGGLTATPHGMTAVTSDPSGLTWLVQPTFVPPHPGTYTARIFGQPAFGADVSASVTFRAVATAGGSLDPIAPDPPAVITARLVPKPDATGVSVTVYPQIAFTEPVKGVVEGQTLTLTDATGASVPVVLLGVGPNGPLDHVTADTVVTSLTLQPLTGLRYGTRYTLRLTSGIVDVDTDPVTGAPTPHALALFESSFTTFDPVSLGATEEHFTAGGLAILGDRAYVAENQGRITAVRLYDVSDPTTPLEITGEATGSFALDVPPPVFVAGHPADLAAEEQSPLTGGPVVAVATRNLAPPWQPSNVRLYDVSNDQAWHWIGAVSLGSSPIDGQIHRIVLRGELLYAVTAGVGKGIQVVDLAKAREIFDAQTANGERDPMFWEMQQRLGLEGQGFAQEAIVQTIFLDTGTGQNSLQQDLAVIDLNVDGVTQPIVVATGRTPLSVVNPQTGEVLYNGPICADGVAACDAANALTSWGWTIAAGIVQGRSLAFVSATPATGFSGSASMLAVIDLTDVRTPRALGTLTFAGNPASQGLVLQGEQVFIGTDTGTLAVSATDPASPRLVSTIAGVGGRLTLTNDELLYGTVRSASTLQHGLGGVRSASTAPAVPALVVSPHYILVQNGKAAEDVTFTYRILARGDSVDSARIEVRDDEGTLVYTTPVPVQDVGQVLWARGTSMRPTSRTLTLRVRNDGRQSASIAAGTKIGRTAVPRLISVTPPVLRVGAPDPSLLITGENLGSAPRVTFSPTDGTPLVVSAQSPDGMQLNVRLPATVAAVEGTVTITVMANGTASNAVSVCLLSAATAPDLFISEIKPQSIESGREDGLWVTVTGQNFVDGDSCVYARTQEVALTTLFVSTTQLRAYIPGVWLAEAGDLPLYVASAAERSAASPPLVLHILRTGAAESAAPLSITTTAPASFGFISTPESPSREIRLLGTGFTSSSIGEAVVNGGPPHPVETLLVSAEELKVVLTRDEWAEQHTYVSFILTTTNGERHVTRTLVNEEPQVILTSLGRHATDIDPSKFATNTTASLLASPQSALFHLTPSGGPAENAFTQNLEGLHIEVVDPALKQMSDAQINLVSEDADGKVVDRISVVEVISPSAGRLKSGDARGRQIAVTTNAIDDGASNREDSVANPIPFDGDDNKSHDRTIQTGVNNGASGVVGGRLRAEYLNKARPSVPSLTAEADVCPPARRSRMMIRVYNFTGGADAVKYLQQARSIWAQVCVEVAVTFESTPSVPADLLSPPDLSIVPRLDLGPLATERRPSREMIDLIDLTRTEDPATPGRNAAWEHEIALYFVKGIRSSSDTLIGGLALTDTGRFENLPEGAPPPLVLTSPKYLGVAFIATEPLLSQGPSGKDVAHELAHLVFGPFHTDRRSGRPYDVWVSVLFGTRTPYESWLQRRFTTRQAQEVRGALPPSQRSRFLR